MAEALSRARLIALSCASAVIAAACASYAPTRGSLAGTAWTAQSIDGRGMVGARTPTVRFGADQRVSGTGGCNSYFGTYRSEASTVESNASALSVSGLGRTEMACDTPIMAQEDAFLTTLGAANHYRIGEDGLLIVATEDSHRVVFSRAPG